MEGKKETTNVAPDKPSRRGLHQVLQEGNSSGADDQAKDHVSDLGLSPEHKKELDSIPTKEREEVIAVLSWFNGPASQIKNLVGIKEFFEAEELNIQKIFSSADNSSDYNSNGYYHKAHKVLTDLFGKQVRSNQLAITYARESINHRKRK